MALRSPALFDRISITVCRPQVDRASSEVGLPPIDRPATAGLRPAWSTRDHPYWCHIRGARPRGVPARGVRGGQRCRPVRAVLPRPGRRAACPPIPLRRLDRVPRPRVRRGPAGGPRPGLSLVKVTGEFTRMGRRRCSRSRRPCGPCRPRPCGRWPTRTSSGPAAGSGTSGVGGLGGGQGRRRAAAAGGDAGEDRDRPVPGL